MAEFADDFNAAESKAQSKAESDLDANLQVERMVNFFSKLSPDQQLIVKERLGFGPEMGNPVINTQFASGNVATRSTGSDQKAADDVRSLPAIEEKTGQSSAHSHQTSQMPASNVTNPASNAKRPNILEPDRTNLHLSFPLPLVPEFPRVTYATEYLFVVALISWMLSLVLPGYHIEDTKKVNQLGSRRFTFNRCRPDISVFMKDPSVVRSDTMYKEDSDDPVRFKCFPWDYVTAIEAKPIMNGETHFYQICQYLRNILLASPGRRFIIGALADQTHIRIFKVSRDSDDTLEDDVVHTYTPKLPLDHIISLLSASPDVLGYTNRLVSPLGEWTISSWLGQSVNYVAKVTNSVTGVVKAVKLFHSNQDAYNEIVVWNALKKNYDDQGLAFPLVERSVFGNAILMPEFSKGLFDRRKTEESFVALWLIVWESLKKLHDLKYVHGDVRLDNIMKLGIADDVYAKFGVIDFGYTVIEGTKSRVGAFATSSYNSVTEKGVYPVDDAISLLKCRYYLGQEKKNITRPVFEEDWAAFQRKDPKSTFERTICVLDSGKWSGTPEELDGIVKTFLSDARSDKLCLGLLSSDKAI